MLNCLSFFFYIKSDQSFKFCPHQCFYDRAGTWYSSYPGKLWYFAEIPLAILNLVCVFICCFVIAVWFWSSAIINQFTDGEKYGIFDWMHGWLVNWTTKGLFSFSFSWGFFISDFRINFWWSIFYFSFNSITGACLVSRLSSKHGFRREGMILSVLELLLVLISNL